MYIYYIYCIQDDDTVTHKRRWGLRVERDEKLSVHLFSKEGYEVALHNNLVSAVTLYCIALP